MTGLRRSIWWESVLCVLAIEAFLITIMLWRVGNHEVLQFDNKVQIGVFATLPLFVLTVLQIRQSIRLQKATFIKDFVAKLHTETELSQSFHSLVYGFTNSIYEDVRSGKLDPDTSTRPEGLRPFNPDKFQGTEEERRLDALLGYFDIIGYHYHTGAIDMVEIAGVLGYQLAALSTRDVIREYLDSLPKYWAESSFSKRGPKAVAPFRYLTVLLTDFQKFNEKNAHIIESVNRRILG